MAKERDTVRERNSTDTNRRGYSWNCPRRLCCVGPSGQGPGAGFWGGFRLSTPLPTHWFFPWTSRALEKRNKSQALLASGAGLSHSALDSLNTGTFNPCPAKISFQSLSLHAVLVVQGREAGWDPWGGRSHGEFRGNCPLQAREVLRAEFPVAQSTPSTWREHSHGARLALASLQMGTALWMGLSEGTVGPPAPETK